MLRLLTSFAVAGALPAAQAIIVAPDSPCSVNCGNVLQSTGPDDLVCGAQDFAVGTGQLFKQCIDCELSSSYSSGNRSDVQCALYNLRYATSYCLFGYPKNDDVVDAPLCLTTKACGPFKEAIQLHKLSSDFDGLDYCTQWPVSDADDFTGCRNCLRLSNQDHLANFMTALQAGCEQQPPPGTLLGLDGELFSDESVNITAPTPIAAVDPDWFDNGPLTLGAKVGIAVGGFAVVLALVGFCIVWNGKRRRRAYLRNLEKKYGNKGWPSPQNQGEMFETPLSQRPLRGWDDSPMSAQTETEKPWPRYVSPYSSQYNSPVSGNEGPSTQWPAAAAAGKTRDIGVALGGISDEEGDKWAPATFTDGKGKEREAESYELHHVDSAGSTRSRHQTHLQPEAPMLGHPGYGRKSDSPPLKYTLTDADVKSGYAI